MRPLSMLAAGLALVLAPLAHAQTDARLVGTWEPILLVDGDGTHAPSDDEPITLTFEADGRMTFRLYATAGRTSVEDSLEVTIQMEADVVVMQNPAGVERRARFHFEGDELVMSETPLGDVVRFRRVRDQ